MHDPNTVAFQIRWPFRSHPTPMCPEGSRRTLVTVWHRDPEADGSDDSCGWSYPRLTERQRERLKGIAWSEAYEPWFQRIKAKRLEDPVIAECLMRGAVQLVASVLDVDASWDEICAWACRFVNNPLDNFRGGLCHLPGYHTNFEKDTKERREETAYGLFSGIAHHILRDRRPWWRHPRWHVHHWRFQVHSLQDFLRWAFTRCAKCGGRFRWGETGVGTWDGDGPRWFRSENLMHMACDAASRTPEATAASVAD